MHPVLLASLGTGILSKRSNLLLSKEDKWFGLGRNNITETSGRGDSPAARRCNFVGTPGTIGTAGRPKAKNFTRSRGFLVWSEFAALAQLHLGRNAA